MRNVLLAAAVAAALCAAQALATAKCGAQRLGEQPQLDYATKPAPAVKVPRGGGATARLHCEVFARPAARIFWLKNGKPYLGNPDGGAAEASDDLNPGARVLETALVASAIDVPAPAAVGDKAVYTCVAVNDCGAMHAESAVTAEEDAMGEGAPAKGGLLRSLRLRRAAPAAASPKMAPTGAPQIYMWTSDMMEYSNRNVRLACRAYVRRRSQQAGGKIGWFETTDGQRRLIESGEPGYEIMGNGDLIVQSSVWLGAAGPYKTYRCVASNRYGGSATDDIMLYGTADKA